MISNQPGAPGYSNLDYVRNLLTVAAAVVLTVFHRDVSAYVPAAAYLVAGADVTLTHLLKGQGGILHRLEVAVSGFATTVGQVIHLLPSSTPAAVAKTAGEASAVTGDAAALVTPLALLPGTTQAPTHVQVNVGTLPPQAPPPAAAPVVAAPAPGAGSGGAALAEPATAT